MSITIRVDGAEAVSRRLNVNIMDAIRPGIMALAAEVKNRLQADPPPAHSPVIWASAKQKRWWFAHRSEKGLPLDYTRESDPESQRLRASWAIQPTKDGAIVGTRTLYAPWVQAAQPTSAGGPQTAQHKATGWVTDEKVAGDIEREKIAVDAITRALMAAFGG